MTSFILTRITVNTKIFRTIWHMKQVKTSLMQVIMIIVVILTKTQMIHNDCNTCLQYMINTWFSLLRESPSRLLLVPHRFLRMLHHRFLGLMCRPRIMIMFQRRHLLRWRPRFIPICWCCRVLLMVCTLSRTFSLGQAEKVYQP